MNRADILFGGIMAFAMSFLMSLVMTYVSIGLVSNFLTIWMRSFVIGMILFSNSIVYHSNCCQDCENGCKDTVNSY